VRKADILVVAGTSLVVYPAAGLVNYVSPGVPVFVIDPQVPKVYADNVEYIVEKAGEGVRILQQKLKKLELI
jgi:NAD-dependent deacetylase